MRRLAGALLALAIILGFSGALAAHAARIPGIVVLLDMSHGQNPGGLELLMKSVPEAYWIILVATEDDVSNLPQAVVKLADEIRVGGFTPDNLEGVDMVIIGQPTLLPSPDEVQAIVDWFNQNAIRAIWVAADSDYPAQGSETAQQAANMILQALGASIRVDYVSVEDTKSYAGKTYRVIGLVNPDPGAEEVAYGAEKVLFHGPGAVYALDQNGNPVNPVETKVPGVYVIVTTSDGGQIVEHQTSAGGGLDGVFYKAGDTGVFPLLVAQRMSEEPIKTVIASGESPYSGYQAGVTWEYKAIPLDGPAFARNLIYWAVGYMAPFKAYEKAEENAVNSTLEKIDPVIKDVANMVSSVSAKVDQVTATVNDLKGRVDQLSSNVDKLSGDLDTVKSDVNNLKSTVDSLKSDVDGLKSKVDSAAGKASTAQAIGVLALILALVGIAIPFVKK